MSKKADCLKRHVRRAVPYKMTEKLLETERMAAGIVITQQPSITRTP